LLAWRSALAAQPHAAAAPRGRLRHSPATPSSGLLPPRRATSPMRGARRTTCCGYGRLGPGLRMPVNKKGRIALESRKIRPLSSVREPLRAFRWWRWAESNRRPKALHPRHYMLSSSLDLIPEQHDVRSASRDQPASFSQWLTGSHHRRFRDNDPTSRARTQAISGLGLKRPVRSCRRWQL
jgi:hypothetical protein